MRSKLDEELGSAGKALPARVAPVLTASAEKALDLAVREALRLGHNYVGTEHILLGLAAEGDGIAHSVLSSVGFDIDGARIHVPRLVEAAMKRTKAGRSRATRRSVPLSQSADLLT